MAAESTNELTTRYAGQMLGGQNKVTRKQELDQQAAEADPVTRSAAGKQHARGVPIVGPGSLGGCMAGTDPLQALLDKEDEGVLWVDWTPSRMPR
jgi:hypothetical protein